MSASLPLGSGARAVRGARPARAPRSPHGRPLRTFAESWPVTRLLAIALVLAGAGVLLYPSAAEWLSDRVHATAVSGYVETVDGLASADQQQAIAAAQAYNAQLPAGPVADPYTSAPSAAASQAELERYDSLLRVGDSGMMGYLSIPEIGVSLPVYHGTSDETLAQGIGHLFGTALPVGGAGTHAVLTGHSGYVNSTLLNGLQDLQLGDTFSVTVLDQVFTYRVTDIRTVLPDETDSLQAVPGEDLLTLVTCTPIGINSHRLLVTGERILTPPAGAGPQTVASDGVAPGFPWWALAFIGAVAAAILLTLPLRQRRPAGEPARHAAVRPRGRPSATVAAPRLEGLAVADAIAGRPDQA